MAPAITELTTGPEAGLAIGLDSGPEPEMAETQRTENSKFFADHSEEWLGDLDSNQDSQIQNLESYRWTISHPLLRKTSRGTFSETNALATLHF